MGPKRRGKGPQTRPQTQKSRVDATKGRFKQGREGPNVPGCTATCSEGARSLVQTVVNGRVLVGTNQDSDGPLGRQDDRDASARTKGNWDLPPRSFWPSISVWSVSVCSVGGALHGEETEFPFAFPPVAGASATFPNFQASGSLTRIPGAYLENARTASTAHRGPCKTRSGPSIVDRRILGVPHGRTLCIRDPDAGALPITSFPYPGARYSVPQIPG